MPASNHADFPEEVIHLACLHLRLADAVMRDTISAHDRRPRPAPTTGAQLPSNNESQESQHINTGSKDNQTRTRITPSVSEITH